MKHRGKRPPSTLHGIEALAPQFYDRDTLSVAKDLLGKIIVRRNEGPGEGRDEDVRVARIVETEAYPPHDPASHAYRGITTRNRVMFGPPGRAYVYLIYGVHHCLNAVTEADGTGGAVLIRAATPLYGLEAMWQSRFPGVPAEGLPAMPLGACDKAGIASCGRLEERTARRLTGGPGKLTRALSIYTNEDNGVPLYEGALLVARYVNIELNGQPVQLTAPATLDIVRDERIGISRAPDKQWRFTVAGNGAVSRKPAHTTRSFRRRPQ